ncbi:unnamed protein product [Boreogadus saida]
MTSTEQRISQAGGSGSGEASDKRPFSGPPESAPGARSFSRLLCASCPASLAPGDGHVACFRCLCAEHAAAAMAPSVSCVSCRELPEEGILSRHLHFSPAVDLADAIDLFRASPDYHDGVIDADDDAVSIDDVFDDSAPGVSRSRVSTATAVERERPRRMADLFGEIMGEAAAIKGIPMPAPPLAPISDDMQGECFRTPSSSRRVTQCPLYPPVQHFFSAAGGDPSTLKAPVKSYTDFTNVEGWADTQARGIPRLEPPLAALLCPGARWRPNEQLPPDRLQKQIVGLTDRVFVCASQSAAAVNDIALLSSAMVSLSADREAYGPEEAARWLAVSRFSSAILQLCQPIAVSAGRHMAWATMIQRIIWLSHTAVPERERASLVQGPDGASGEPRFSEVLAHQQSVRENRSRFGAILTGSSHQQAGRKRGPGRSQRSSGPPPTPAPVPQQHQQQQPPPPRTGGAAPRTGKFRKLALTFSFPNKEKKNDRSTERQYMVPKERYSLGSFHGRLYRSPGSPHYSVEAVGAEEYGLFLDGLPQLSARPLSNRYACWQERCVLPSWLDTTLRWGHPIQFKRRPPPFMGLVETTLRDPAASTALAAEVARLLAHRKFLRFAFMGMAFMGLDPASSRPAGGRSP